MHSATRLALASLPHSAALLALASLLTLPLLGCGSVTATVPGVSPEDAPAQLSMAVCSAAYHCCAANQLMSNDQAGTDEPDCEMKTKAALTQQVAGIKASEAKGRVVYDGTKVDACIKYLNAASCADLRMVNHFSAVAACASFLQPKVDVGGACSNDFECVGGFCTKAGVCQALGLAADSCADGAKCAADLSCEATSMTCATPPPPATPTTDACFYSSACSYAGGDRGAESALGIALLLAAVLTRRRARR